MTESAITWSRAAKVWLSFLWRSSVVTIAVTTPLELLIRYAATIGNTNILTKEDSGHTAMLLALLLVAITAMVISQILAMWWTLKRATWADFKIALLPIEQ